MADDLEKWKKDVGINPWHPISDPVLLKTLGKLSEEIHECSEALSRCGAAVARCIIQGIDESEPLTGRVNRHRLENELADVLAGFRVTIDKLKLDEQKILDRAGTKAKGLLIWHDLA